MTRIARTESLSPALFLGFAVSSIGGPLALVALYLPGAADEALRSAGLTTLVAVGLFVFAVLIWYRYSRAIASAGGLYAFVRAGAGSWPAAAQGWIWTVAYFLYLPYTVTYVAYDLLPEAFPGFGPYRAALTVAFPVALTLALAFADRAIFVALALAAVVQVAVVLALGAVELDAGAARSTSFAVNGDASALAFGSLAVSLLFLCGSLPVFLGGEVEGGGRTVRRGLVVAFALVAVALVFAAFPFAGVGARATQAEIPGYAVANLFGSRPFADVVAAVAALSVLGLVAAEYVALTRLLHAMIGRPLREVVLAIGAVFVLLAAVSLFDPHAFYERLALPSLVALYVSQLIVFAVFPLFRHRRNELSATDVVASLATSALMGYGLWVLATEGVAT